MSVEELDLGYPDYILLHQTRYRGSRNKLQLLLEYSGLETYQYVIQYLDRTHGFEFLNADKTEILDSFEICGRQSFEDPEEAYATYDMRRKVEPWNATVLGEIAMENWRNYVRAVRSSKIPGPAFPI